MFLGCHAVVLGFQVKLEVRWSLLVVHFSSAPLLRRMPGRSDWMRTDEGRSDAVRSSTECRQSYVMCVGKREMVFSWEAELTSTTHHLRPQRASRAPPIHHLSTHALQNSTERMIKIFKQMNSKQMNTNLPNTYQMPNNKISGRRR